MEDNQDFPEESMQHIEALLSRHPPQMIQRMFQQVLESRRSSIASSYTSSTNSSLHSRLSFASTFSTSTTSTGSSDWAPSIASSASSRSRISSRSSARREPRSYPSGLDPTRPKPAILTPTSESSSPLDTKMEPIFTPTEEDGVSIASPVTFHGERSQSQSQSQSQAGDSFMFCTYCAEINSLKTFKAKSDWKKHEMRMHETGEDWPCPVIGCNRVYDRQKDFIKHHTRYHSGRPLPSLTDIGIRLLPRRVFGCGFEKCKDVSIGWDERCDHVAKHMKNGATFDQWKYSNVIRNLIRQEALHDTWKELFASLDDRLKESRSQITWSPDNTRTLRQKLQCCDLRPSREEVLITALSLRSDLPLETTQIQVPPGFTTPCRDSVPNLDQLSREQRMHILIGNSNISLSRTQLVTVNAALLQIASTRPSFNMAESPIISAEPERRISFMDLDGTDYLSLADPAIPSLPSNLDPQPSIDVEQSQNTAFLDPTKPANPLNWCYPNYFDNAPSFEESPYYDRPSIGQMFSRPLQKISSRFTSRHGSPHSRPASRTDEDELPPPEYGMALPMQQQPQHPPPHAQSSQPQPHPQSHQQHVPLLHPHPMTAMRHQYQPLDQLQLFSSNI